MHSFHHSRARVLFEVLCAFGMAASCVGAWLQTYAPAFLPAAAIAALYGLVHAFDLRRREPALAAAVDSIEIVSPGRETGPEPAPEPAPPLAEVAPEPAPATPPAKRVPRKKAAKSKAAPPVAAPTIAEVAPEPQRVDDDPEPDYAPIAPLFVPEPFVRTQRAAFGRKAG